MWQVWRLSKDDKVKNRRGVGHQVPQQERSSMWQVWRLSKDAKVTNRRGVQHQVPQQGRGPVCDRFDA